MVTHSKISSAVADELFECVDHFVGLTLKGLTFIPAEIIRNPMLF